MKKLHKDLKVIVFQKRDEVRKKRKENRAKRNLMRKKYGEKYKHEIKKTTINAPKQITLNNSKHRSKLISFLTRLRKYLSTGEHVILNFSRVNAMEPHASLLLWAELSSVRRFFPEAPFKAILPRDNLCRQVFSQVGLARQLKSKEIKTSHDSVVHWNAEEGTDVDGEAYAERLMKPYEDKISPEIINELWSGVQEAMTNVRHHAYSKSRDKKYTEHNSVNCNWWMFSQERDGKLTVLICDLGAGIPRTIPETKNTNLTAVRRWLRFSSRKDGPILSAVLKKTVLDALPVDRKNRVTRTGEPHRGWGFYNIVRAVRRMGTSLVSIHSNRGWWISRETGDQNNQTFEDSIGGTIISWQIPLDNKE